VSERLAPELREAAIAFAREAGQVVREGWGRDHDPEHKGVIDLVTEYDRRSEATLLDRIAARFPGHAVLAEESGGAREPRGVRWIIDPLDGTTNFAHNYPFFAVSVGVEIDGRMVAGAVHDPVRDETFAAALGAGATRNGAPIHVSRIARVGDALLVTGFPYDVRERPRRYLEPFEAFLLRAQGVRRDGSAALNLCYLACGRFDGFWEYHLSPWDMAAGTLIVTEAGGRVTRLDGSEFRLDGREILASNGSLHEEMRGILDLAITRVGAGPRPPGGP
jgi:myo-inositol-1(or 4)-monophosphatase